MKKTMILGLMVVVFLSTAFVTRGSVQMSSPGAYDLIAAVNALRATYGLGALEVDGALMAAAKVQADYLASIGGANIANGHQGAGGTYAYDRAAAAGYPLPQGVDVLECWAWANNSQSLSYIISGIWGDAAHMEVMLHKYGKHVGAGVTEKDGSVYYILDVSTVWGVATGGSSGSETNTGSTPASLPTRSTTPQVVPVIVSTPKADGSIIHVVQPGQALWSIARAYGVTEEQLRQMNNFSTNASTIYVGETLLIRPAHTPTVQPTITSTPRQPTRTPVPAQAVATLPPVQTPVPASAPTLFAGVDRTPSVCSWCSCAALAWF
jgi:LysM repeat protein